MSKIISKLVFCTLVLAGVLGIFSLGVNKLNLVLAQNINDGGITYPIKELGDCANKSECKTYCDKKANQEACLDFAGQNGMMKKTEIDQAKKVLQLSEQGIDTPGACKGQEECDAYCSDSAHLDECVTFGEKAGLISPEEVKMIKKTGGKGPGSCQGKKACDDYCQNEANLDECIAFAEQNGMMTAQEKEMIKKTGGKGPGGCKGKTECDAFCQQENNFDACLEFGHQNGMMNDEEYAMAKKSGLKMMKEGGPGGCKGKEECDAFCGDEKNFDACIEFGHENGFMSDEEYAQAKKMGPKAFTQGGPGGCKGKEECKGYCDNPGHSEACIKFAEENNLLSPEEIQKMKQGGFMVPPSGEDFTGPGGCKTQQECMAFCSQKENDQTCKMFGAGPQIGPAEDTFKEGGTGPGGCTSPESCMEFCSDKANQETCMNFRPPEPVKPPEGYQEGQDPNQKMTGPGGCTSPEECEAYCSSHGEECGAPSSPQDEGDNQQMLPGDFQIPRIEPGQNQPMQPGLGGSEPEQGMGLSSEQVEQMNPGQPEFSVPPSGSQSTGEFNPPMVENKLNQEFILQEGQPMQSPAGEGGQLPNGIQPTGQMEQVPFVQQQQASPPSDGGEVQPPPPVSQPAPQIEQAPAPQALNAPRLLISALNFFASAMTLFFSR